MIRVISQARQTDFADQDVRRLWNALYEAQGAIKTSLEKLSVMRNAKHPMWGGDMSNPVLNQRATINDVVEHLRQEIFEIGRLCEYVNMAT